MTLAGFTLGRGDFAFVGRGLSRPESVLAERDGTLFVSDNRGGVTRIAKDGSQVILGAIGGVPNGLALAADGAILVANAVAVRGALHRIERDGTAAIVLDSFAGAPLGSVNFVYRDPAADRLWLTISTRTDPVAASVRAPVADGYILALEPGGTRLAAAGFHHTNEVRIDRNRRFLYVAETALGRVLRLPLAPDGSLGQREVFGPERLFPGALVDGIAFDCEGNLWVTEVSRNGIHVIAPDGSCRCVFEDRDGDTLVFPASLAFADDDLRTVLVGSVRMDRLARFRSPVAGEPLAHWR